MHSNKVTQTESVIKDSIRCFVDMAPMIPTDIWIDTGVLSTCSVCKEKIKSGEAVFSAGIRHDLKWVDLGRLHDSCKGKADPSSTTWALATEKIDAFNRGMIKTISIENMSRLPMMRKPIPSDALPQGLNCYVIYKQDGKIFETPGVTVWRDTDPFFVTGEPAREALEITTALQSGRAKLHLVGGAPFITMDTGALND